MADRTQEARERADARPLYWCPCWQTLNVTPCPSCSKPQVAYYRQEAYDALAGRVSTLETALRDMTESVDRTLRHGHDFWEKHQNSPDSDEFSAALTHLYMARKRHASVLAALAEGDNRP